jgi:hypothetical protein
MLQTGVLSFGKFVFQTFLQKKEWVLGFLVIGVLKKKLCIKKIT